MPISQTVITPVKAWGTVYTPHATAPTFKSSGIASIVGNGTGNYTVTFSAAMPDANYTVQLNDWGASAGNKSYVASRTAAAFVITLVDTTGASWTGGRFSFTVIDS